MFLESFKGVRISIVADNATGGTDTRLVGEIDSKKMDTHEWT